MASERKKHIECVPNFSEGKNKKTIQEILKSIKSVASIKLLHYTSDPSHNRTVVTFAGQPEAVVEGAFQAAKTAAKLINLKKHKGVHPRTGATDVIPLIPLKNISMQTCAKYASKLAEKISAKLNMPIFLYEEASPHNTSLPQIRKTIRLSGSKKADFGRNKKHPAGITIVGARNFLIAFNINLKSRDLKTAKKIAEEVRSRWLRALGFFLPHKNAVQISMNLINYKKINIHQAFKKVEKASARHGITILESDLVGMIPKDAWEKARNYNLKLRNFSKKQILDTSKI